MATSTDLRPKHTQGPGCTLPVEPVGIHFGEIVYMNFSFSSIPLHCELTLGNYIFFNVGAMLPVGI